jgi:NADH-quinone oxidoreductase subunit K
MFHLGRGSVGQVAVRRSAFASIPSASFFLRSNFVMTPTLQYFVIVSSALFSIGLLAVLSRRHAIFILIGIELMLAAANVNFVAFWRFNSEAQDPTGVLVAIFAIAIAAAEAAVGLALVIAVYRHYRTTDVDRLDQLKG